MIYQITQKAVDEGRYEELGEIELIEAVDGFVSNMLLRGYLEPKNISMADFN